MTSGLQTLSSTSSKPTGEELPDPPFEGCLICNLALPNDECIPTEVRQVLDGFRVPDFCCRELGAPESFPGLRDGRLGASVLVPETAMDKNDLLMLGENKVRAPRKSTSVQAVSKTQSVAKTPNNHLWLRVFASDSGHHPTPCLGVDGVSHGG